MLDEFLFPRRCPVCDKIAKPFGSLCCTVCRKRLLYIGQEYCMKCGKGLSDKEEAYCNHCRNYALPFVRGRSLYRYESVAGSIFRFKYQERQEYADFFGEELYRHFANDIKQMRADAMIPVPLHEKRLRERGYNQSALLARVLSKKCGVPCKENFVIRQKNTVSQKKLNYAERQNNLKKAFKLYGNDVKLNVVIIIDDIYTTGSTVGALSEVLLEGGVKEVYVLTLASGVE